MNKIKSLLACILCHFVRICAGIELALGRQQKCLYRKADRQVTLHEFNSDYRIQC